MTRASATSVDLVMVAIPAVIACRAGRACPTHKVLAQLLGCGVSTVRLALYRLHGAHVLKVETLAGDTGTRTRMRVRLAEGGAGRRGQAGAARCRIAAPWRR